jgi:hypothetical protein
VTLYFILFISPLIGFAPTTQSARVIGPGRVGAVVIFIGGISSMVSWVFGARLGRVGLGVGGWKGVVRLFLVGLVFRPAFLISPYRCLANFLDF